MDQQTSIVLSFDVGTVNMSACLAEIHHPYKRVKIRRWKLVNVDMGNIERTSATIVASLDTWFGTEIKNNKNTWVLVERQVPSNYNCLCLSYVLWTYYMTKYNEINVSFVSAKSKPITSSGRKRKRESVRNAKETLIHHSDQHWYDWLMLQNKKDDLTDAYLQIIGNVENMTYYNIKNVNVNVIDSD
jgi:hypothetical protein